MTETRLLDFSDARPSPAQIKRAGSVGVMRYVTRSTGPKRISAAEAKTYRDAGLWVGLVFEDTADRAHTGGHAAGVADAQLAAAQAKAIGYPAGCVIFYAVDYAARWSDVAEYFRGVRETVTPYPPGDYGDFTVVEGAAAAGIRWHWQTVAWSSHQISSHAHLYQRNTETVAVAGTDENVLLHPVPLWGAPTAPSPAPKPDPKPTPTPAPVTAPQEAPVLFLAYRSDHRHFIVEASVAGLAKRQINPTSEEPLYRAAGIKPASPALTDAQLDAIPDAK